MYFSMKKMEHEWFFIIHFNWKRLLLIIGTSGIDQSSGKPAIETVGPRGANKFLNFDIIPLFI